MKEEMKALKKNSTWEIVDRPKDKRVVDYEETFAPTTNINTILSGFYSHNEKNKVYRLKKALYGLKQSPRAWFGRFAQVMISLDRVKHSPDGKFTLLLIYVDDMIVIDDDEIEKPTLKENLATQFEMKESGKLKYYLGIEVADNSFLVVLCALNKTKANYSIANP
ncbi:hypothetical protein CR513_47709, partial [Mucuna pruriens]